MEVAARIIAPHQQGPSTNQSGPYLRNGAEKAAQVFTRLSTFHKDRPKRSRNLPEWNLSVVLNELKKAPFEPMKDTDLKHLTLKTAFLLALASGKCRSKIHAWQTKYLI